MSMFNVHYLATYMYHNKTEPTVEFVLFENALFFTIFPE